MYNKIFLSILTFLGTPLYCRTQNNPPDLGKTSSTFQLASHSSVGRLYVIVGPMACGKTEELMRIIRVLRISKAKVLACKHSLDTRSSNLLVSRGRPDEEIEAHPISDPKQILEYYEKEPFDYLAFDEVMFASYEMVEIIQKLLALGVNVIVSGLDMDFKKEPFGLCMPYLISIADEVIKLKAVCSVCGDWTATLTQRLVDGQPAHRNAPLVLVDDGKTHNVVYEPRCRKCHVLSE